ncbi:MAG: hypothetical protein KY452_03635 [Actinobacteria bacterium]|nr:hypothetical protein [Actinomycetota bacterium]
MAKTRGRHTLDAYQWSNGATPAERLATGWKPSAELEQLRRLRDSADTKERAIYERISPSQRMTLGHYELGLRAHVAAGRDVPDGVAPPEPPSAA